MLDTQDSDTLAKDGEVSEQVGIQSVEVAAGLLGSLAALMAGGTLPNLKTLADHAGMPASKAHRYVTSLVRSGLVEKEPVGGRYRLGATARQIGIVALQGLDIMHLGVAKLPGVRDAVGHTVAMAIWALQGPTIVLVEEVRTAITISTRVGQVMPLLSSATGRVFGAWKRTADIKNLIEKELKAPEFPVACRLRSISEADAMFADIRDRGFTSVQGELNPQISAVAAPVFDFRGSLVAAICALGPSANVDVDPDGSLSRVMREAAADMSQKMGYHAAAQVLRDVRIIDV